MSATWKFSVTVMDGAMGTLLLARGFSLGDCLEELNLSRPAVIETIHKNYLEAGAEAIVTNTFGGNRVRLESKGVGQKLEGINRKGVEIAHSVAGEKKVFASIGPLGPTAKKMTPLKMTRLFKEQAGFLEKEKPDGYLIETMISLQECESAVRAVREISNRPIVALMTFPNGLGVIGEPGIIASTLRSAGADVIGVNCGTGPGDCFAVLQALTRVNAGPFCVRPAAGLPGKLVSPEEFADWGLKFKKLGCEWLGGCCGTTPEYIRALKTKLE